jgi:hypothetical protein
MKISAETVRLASGDDSIAPVSILDAQGQVLRVVTAEEFRRTHSTDASTFLAEAKSRRRRQH